MIDRAVVGRLERIGVGTAIRQATLALSTIHFLIALPLWWLYDPVGAEYQFVERVSWIPALGVEYHLGVDGVSILLALLTVLLTPLAVLGSWRYIERHVKEFHILLLVLTTGMLGVFFALDLFYRRTLTGKAFRAVAHSGEVSGLMGINTRRVQAVSYSAAAALAGFAGFLVVPLTLAEPQLGTVLGLKAFAIAIIAGLAAPRGILVCGLGYGALEALISGYFYTGIRDILGFSLMILALFLKPEGLFGRRIEERA